MSMIAVLDAPSDEMITICSDLSGRFPTNPNGDLHVLDEPIILQKGVVSQVTGEMLTVVMYTSPSCPSSCYIGTSTEANPMLVRRYGSPDALGAVIGMNALHEIDRTDRSH